MNRIRSFWRRWWTVPVQRRRGFGAGLILVPLIHLGFRRRGLAITAGLDRVPLRRGGSTTDPAVRAIEFGRGVQRAATVWRIPDRSCMARASTTWLLCRAAGIDACVRLGAAPPGEGIEAHAWVEVDGQPVDDRADVAERYPPFADPILPRPASR